MRQDFLKIAKIVVSLALLAACKRELQNEAEVQATTQAEQCSESVDLNVAKDQSL